NHALRQHYCGTDQPTPPDIYNHIVMATGGTLEGRLQAEIGEDIDLSRLGVTSCSEDLSQQKKKPAYLDRAISFLSQAIPQDSIALPLWYSYRGCAYKDRFLVSKDLSDSTKAIDYLTRAVPLIPPNDLPGLLNFLGVSYTNRFEQEPKIEHLDKAIENFTRAIELTPPGDSELPVRLCNQGFSYKARFPLSHNFADIEEATKWYTQAAALGTGNNQEIAEMLNQLGVIYCNQGHLVHINRAIDCFSNAISLVLPNYPALPLWLKNQGCAYKERFSQSKDLGDTIKAIDSFTRAVSLTPPNDESLPERLNFLAIDNFTHAIELTPPGDSELPVRLCNQGYSYKSRFSLSHNFADIEEAIRWYTQAAVLGTGNNQEIAEMLNQLGVSCTNQFEQESNLAYIDRAIDCFSHAIPLVPRNYPTLPIWLTKQGYAYKVRFTCSNHKYLGDIAKAIDLFTSAVSLTSPNDESLPERLNYLGVSYMNEFDYEPNIEYLDEAIKNFTRAIQLTPHGDHRLLPRLRNQASSYETRFSLSNDFGDMEEAIKWYIQASSFGAGNNYDIAEILNKLGVTCVKEFSRENRLEYIDQAITCVAQAISLVPEGHPSLPLWLSNKGYAYKARFSVSHSFGDVVKAIEWYTEAAALRNSDKHEIAEMLNKLGVICGNQLGEQKKLVHMDRAISCFSHAIALVPRDYPALPLWLENQGCGYKDRFSLSKILGDIIKAIDSFTDAVSLTPPNNGSLPERLNYLGVSYSDRFDQEPKIQYIEKAFDCFSSAVELTPEGDPALPLRTQNKEHAHRLAISGDRRPLPVRESTMSEVLNDIVTSSMSCTEVVALLTAHGCGDLTASLSGPDCAGNRVAEGGLGDVFYGKLLDGTPVAIKTLRSSYSPGEVDRVYHKRAAEEIYTWSKCNHPNVARLMGLAVFRDCLAMVSGWEKNGTLTKYLEYNPSANRCQLSISISAGLAYLHDRKIIHGDLKGANVLISQDGTPMLTDFGNARLQDATLQFTKNNTSCLSLRWTPPEMLGSVDSDEPVSHTMAGDIYSLGMTILEAFTSQVPFAKLRNEFSLVRWVAIDKKIPDRPENIPPNSRDGDRLWDILRRCWSFDPSGRPNANEVKNEMATIRSENLRI
ncbi:unnamed protein product, partial [Rhizoctonia solani]